MSGSINRQTLDSVVKEVVSLAEQYAKNYYFSLESSLIDPAHLQSPLHSSPCAFSPFGDIKTICKDCRNL